MARKRTQKWRGSRHFRQNSRPFHLPLLGFAHVSDVGDTWWQELEHSNHRSSRLGGLMCRWQRHSVKTFLLRVLNDSWAGQNPQGLQCRLKKKNSFLGVFYMFWTSRVHHQEDYLYMQYFMVSSTSFHLLDCLHKCVEYIPYHILWEN